MAPVEPNGATTGVLPTVEIGLLKPGLDRLKSPGTRIDSAQWMAYIDDEVPIAGLTIPGTHDSAAFTNSWPFVATQKMDLREQLDAGIRYFDFRCGLRKDVIEMVQP